MRQAEIYVDILLLVLRGIGKLIARLPRKEGGYGMYVHVTCKCNIGHNVGQTYIYLSTERSQMKMIGLHWLTSLKLGTQIKNLGLRFPSIIWQEDSLEGPTLFSDLLSLFPEMLSLSSDKHPFCYVHLVTSSFRVSKLQIITNVKIGKQIYFLEFSAEKMSLILIHPILISHLTSDNWLHKYGFWLCNVV